MTEPEMLDTNISPPRDHKLTRPQIPRRQAIRHRASPRVPQASDLDRRRSRHGTCRGRSSPRVPAMKVLVTGGAGYIGSVTATALEQAGHTPVLLDSLLVGPRAFVRDRIFYQGDIADRDLLARIVAEHPDLDATIHMAARIVVPESVALPYEYYRDNVAKSLELFDQLEQLGKPRVVFSSSASCTRPRTTSRSPRPTRCRRPRRTPGPSDDGAGPDRHRRRRRPAGGDPALLQPDRLRPGPRSRASTPASPPTSWASW